MKNEEYKIYFINFKGGEKMVKMYRTDMKTNQFSKVNDFERGTWINMVNPNEEEIEEICEELKIDSDFIKYPLDYEEKARIDKEDDATLFIIDVPIIEEKDGKKLYTTMPLGMIVVRDDFFITVSLRETSIIKDFEKGRIKNFYTYKKTRFILQILYNNSSHFLSVLKQINKQSEATVFLLQKSMRNRELIQLLDLENSLVYIATSLRSNEIVMEKCLNGRIIKLYNEDEDILDDAIVENKQAIEMSKIYSDILSGTMDAYASIISNNLNVVMKFLAAITIVLSLPTMLASFWGMNVANMPFTDNPYGFWILIGISIIIAGVSAIWLKRRDMF